MSLKSCTKILENNINSLNEDLDNNSNSSTSIFDPNNEITNTRNHDKDIIQLWHLKHHPLLHNKYSF